MQARVAPCMLTYPKKTTFCLERSQLFFSYVKHLLHKMQKHVYKLVKSTITHCCIIIIYDQAYHDYTFLSASRVLRVSILPFSS